MCVVSAGAGRRPDPGANRRCDGTGRRPSFLARRWRSPNRSRCPSTQRPLSRSSTSTESNPVELAYRRPSAITISWQCLSAGVRYERSWRKARSYTKISSLAARYTSPSWNAMPRRPRSAPRPSHEIDASFQSITWSAAPVSRSTRYTPPWLSPWSVARTTELTTTRGRVEGSSGSRPERCSPVEVVLIPQVDQLSAADPLERFDVLRLEAVAPAAGAAAGERAAAGRPHAPPHALDAGLVQRATDVLGDPRDGRALVVVRAAAGRADQLLVADDARPGLLQPPGVAADAAPDVRLPAAVPVRVEPDDGRHQPFVEGAVRGRVAEVQ